MANIEILNDIPSPISEAPFREGLIHQAVVTYESNQRVDLAATKSRGKVSGRNKKPWRQKGTGRSRHGSRISPLWVGGGRAHAPDGSQNHQKEMTKRMKTQALYSAINKRFDEDAIHQCTPPELNSPSTASMDEFFTNEQFGNSDILFMHGQSERTVRLSTRNLSYCNPFEVSSLNTYQVVSHPVLVFTKTAWGQFAEEIKSNGSN